MTAEEFNRAGIAGESWRGEGLAVFRAKCFDCSCYQETEIRKCVVVTCANSPYRMNANPLRVKRVLSDEQRAAAD